MSALMFKRLKSLLLMTITSAALSGCAGDGAGSKAAIVAKVNNESITSDELQKNIAARVRSDPSFKITPDTEKDELSALIEKKLIIQEALKVGLAREQSFVEAIKALWEKLLIRDFVEFKKNEFKDYLFVTDDDVEKYLTNLSNKKTFLIFKSSTRADAEKALANFNLNGATTGWKALGPVAYDEVQSDALLEAFELEAGQVQIFEDRPDYYVIKVDSAEQMNVDFMRDLRPEIEKRVLAAKEKRLFDKWLERKKASSNIKLIKG